MPDEETDADDDKCCIMVDLAGDVDGDPSAVAVEGDRASDGVEADGTSRGVEADEPAVSAAGPAATAADPALPRAAGAGATGKGLLNSASNPPKYPPAGPGADVAT